MKKNLSIFILINFLSIPSLKAQLSFSKIPSSNSGVDFVNIITESNLLNEFNYYYLYNGGGVSIGDINNDGLPDLYFTGNLVPNKLYLNLGEFKFKDITDSANVNGGEGYKTGVTMVDINGDGYLDIYVCRSVSSNPNLRKNLLYVNNGDLTFSEKAKEFGIDDASYSTQAYFYDMDLDGDLDLFLLNHPSEMFNANDIHLGYNNSGNLEAKKDTTRINVSNRYYENINNHFYDKTISEGLGTSAFGLSAIIADFNSDGYPDIYVCNDVIDPDYLFINNKDKTFTNKADDYFQHYCSSSMGSDYADINNDGYLDLVVLDMLPESFQRQKELIRAGNYDDFYKRKEYGFSAQYVKNVLQLNNGNQTYSDISYMSGISATEWSWSPLLADFDNDGLKDLYITNGYLRDVTNLDFIMFKADSIKKELYKLSKTNDVMKLLSEIPSIKLQNYFYKNNGNLTFKNATLESGMNTPSWSNGAVYGDLDNDGDLDIIVNNIFDAPFIYRNNTTENKTNNYIRFKLIGTQRNPNGIGAIINIQTADGKNQIQHFMPDKGYLSCNEWFIHFGLGQNTIVNVTINWPNGLSQTINNLEANKVYTLNIENAIAKQKSEENIKPLFKDITSKTTINYYQKENAYIDFKLEPLLPHQFSKMGPCIAIADINGDHTDDIFIGGSKDHSKTFYIQEPTGKFKLINEAEIIEDEKFEDTGAAFLDLDNDGDQDLIVVSGGNEYPDNPSMYPIRIYNNDGKGGFTKSSELQNIYTSGKAIAIEDFDKDGNFDVFVGGRVVPGHYGLIPKSYLFHNHNGHLTDITNTIPSINKVGMVTDATWSDVDGNGWKDLVIVGEWMPLTIYKNFNGILDSIPQITSNSFGWWNVIEKIDIDGDGDMDLIGGNSGYNIKYKGNDQFPVTMLVNDFDNNGSTDCIISAYQDGVSYPIAMRDNLIDQMPSLKKKLLRYKDYSSEKISDLFTPNQINNSISYKANNIANTLFINDGSGNFSQKNLPVKAQIFQVNAIICNDFDKDGTVDLLLSGNDFSTEIETGRKDAGIGLFLSGQGNNKFKSLPVLESGFYTPGDVKCMKKIIINNKPCIIIGKNQGAIQIIGLNE